MKQTTFSEQLIIENIQPVHDLTSRSSGKKPPFQKTPLNQSVIIGGNIVLVFTAVLCTFGAFISSFSISVNLTALVLFLLISAVIFSITITLYRARSLLALALPLLILLYVNFTEILEGGMRVIFIVTSSYNVWIPVTVLFPEMKTYTGEPIIFLAALGILISILLAFVICLRRSLFGTVLLTAPIIFLTFVITDMQPDLGYLFGIISVYLALLVCGAIAPDDYIKRGMMTFPAIAVSLTFMFLVYLISPFGSYSRNNQIINMGNNFRAFSSQLGQVGQLLGGANFRISWAGALSGGNWHFNTSNVNITDAGRRNITGINLLEINASRAGTFYLRGYSMGSFNGSSWSRDPIDMNRFFTYFDANTMSLMDLNEIDDKARWMPADMADFYSAVNPDSASMQAQMAIRRTGDFTTDITYSPYYNTGHLQESEFLDSTKDFFYIRSVQNLYNNLMEEGFLPGVHFGNILNNDQMRRNYTDVADNTSLELRRIALEAGIDLNAERYTVVDDVARLILSSGNYTLTPERVPDDVDFAVYFLEESKEGYCIHFATAAVLMLRSLDIPARFTSGYVITVSPDQIGRTVELTDANAHAWVEVFYDNIGWLYLEVTPSAGNTYVPQPMPHTPQQDINNEPQTPNTPDPNNNQGPPEGQRPDDIIGGLPAGPGVETEPQNFLRIHPLAFSAVLFGIYILLIIATIIIRRKIMIHIRKERFKQANTNKAVIYIWHYCQKLGRGEVVPPRDIEEIALKARFSQHIITQEERKTMTEYAARLAYEIYNGKEEFSRLWLKYIRALY